MLAINTDSTACKAFKNTAYVLMIVGLPFWVWFCLISVLHYDGKLVLPDAAFWSHMVGPSLIGLAVYIGWLVFQAALYHFLPGKLELGQPLPDGRRLPYALNGWKTYAISLGFFAALHFSGLVPGSWLYKNLPVILGSANFVVFALCFYIYWLGRKQATAEEKERHWLEAFFLGSARNPRNGKFDWKFFCEARPGLTLWVLVSLSCMVHQYETFGHITNSMLLTSFFITLYITDYYVVEDALLTTWDIIHEPFGWMLCWGSLIYVPFFYPLAAIWLAGHDYSLPTWAAVAVFIMGCTGYFIFRQCNIQKHHFRKGLGKTVWGKAPQYIRTARGTKLLISGWWGVASHANYLGDLMLSLAMCIVVGSNTVFGYGYFLAFLILLIHRDWRDDKHCAEKYGDDWKRYRQKVRWHILPGVY